MFRTGDKADFVRMLDAILMPVAFDAAHLCAQVTAEAAARGVALSSSTPILMEKRLAPLHANTLNEVMLFVVHFSKNSAIPIDELKGEAKPRLETFTVDLTEHIAKAANRLHLTQLIAQIRARFDQRLDNALKDVEIGFIGGRSASMTEISTNQSKALRLLQYLYDATRARTDPVFVEELNTGLSEEDAKAAWRYLKDRGLIDTFNLPYTARINGLGVDAVEDAQRRPDNPTSNFPSVTYNIVNNTMNVGAMENSPVQQGGVQSTQEQTISYSTQDVADLKRLVTEVRLRLDDLQLEPGQQRKATAQLGTLDAQLSDDPDPIIVKQAGRTLRNILEGALGSLLATAAQPPIWVWVREVLLRLFG